MSVICPNCGAENRDRARYCTRCAGALPWTNAADGDGNEGKPKTGAARERKQRNKTAGDHRLARSEGAAKSTSTSKAGGLPRWALAAAAVAVVALMVVFWQVLPRGASSPKDTTAPELATPAGNAAPGNAGEASAVTTGTAPPSGQSAVAPAELMEQTEAANQRLQQSLEQLQAEDERKSAERKEQRLKALQERERRQQQQAELARRKAEEAAAAEAARAAAVSPASPATPAAPANSVATPGTSAPAAPAVAGVEQLCAGAGNIFSRDICRIQACGKPEHVSDPICVRYREMNRQNRVGNL